MLPSQDAGRLDEVVRRESRSLLQYLTDSYPWTRAGADEALGKVRELAHVERDAVGGLRRFLTRRQHVVPVMGSYPASFTTMNFVSLDYLAPRLIEDQRRLLAALERDRAALADAEARAELDRLLDVKRHHLHALEALAPALAAK